MTYTLIFLLRDNGMGYNEININMMLLRNVKRSIMPVHLTEGRLLFKEK